MSVAEDAKKLDHVEALKPGREELRNMPGYYERPGKVWRTGVGLVDGYQWGVKFRSNDGHGKLSKQAQAVGELMKPSWEAGTAAEADARGFPGDYGIKGGRVCVSMADSYEMGERRFCPDCRRHRDYCECGHGD